MTTALIAGVQLVIPTIQAGIQLADMLQKSINLFNAGTMTKAQLLEEWKKAGVSVQDADANLTSAMNEREGSSS